MSASPSRHRLTLKLNGKTFRIEIDDLNGSPLEVRVDGKTYQVELQEETVEHIQAPKAVGTSQPGVSRQPAVPSRQPAAAYSAQEIRSPMPGNILDIAVAPGDTVSVGQRLCALEAMKMKSAIRSPREGVIQDVHVNEGQVVVHGELLFTFK
jgi:biotin carboxyl carrier protein